MERRRYVAEKRNRFRWPEGRSCDQRESSSLAISWQWQNGCFWRSKSNRLDDKSNDEESSNPTKQVGGLDKQWQACGVQAVGKCTRTTNMGARLQNGILPIPMRGLVLLEGELVGWSQRNSGA